VRPSAPPDDAKTIAITSPTAIKDLRATQQMGSPPQMAAGDLAETEDIHVEIEEPPRLQASSDAPQRASVPPSAESAIEAMSSFRLAEQALQRNDAKAALDLAQKAVAKDPTQPDYGVLVAWIRSLGGSPRAIIDAIAIMSRALESDPTSERARFFRAKLYVKTNKLDEALADFNELLSMNPQHKEAQAEARLLKTRIK
jgi:tetratricopeptide (TPR) repeat protein